MSAARSDFDRVDVNTNPSIAAPDSAMARESDSQRGGRA
jgi:hypothetical protein